MFSSMTDRDKKKLHAMILKVMGWAESAVYEKNFALADRLVALFAWLQFRAIGSASVSEEREDNFLNWYYRQVPRTAA